MDYHSDIDELIAKYLSEEIDTGEQARLDKWLAESPDNRLYFSQMQRLWQKSELGKKVLPNAVDVEAALVRTKTRIRAKTLKGRITGFSTWRYAMAAAILVLLGAIWFFQRDTTLPSVQLATTQKTLRDTLADGSVVSINQFSSLSASFSKKTRRITMKGEAYFEVAPNPEKPFTVSVGQVEVTVVGTKFNIDNSSDPDWVMVSVEEGKVRVQSGKQVEFLTAGQQARIQPAQGKFEWMRQTPPANASAWANRRFVFDDMPLSEVIPLLEKTYQVKINLLRPELGFCRLHARFNNEPVERILALIADTFSLEINQNNGQYYLDGTGCDR